MITPHLTVSLSPTAHAWARQFAAEQADPQKGKQVYLNTLAVWAVHRYLAWLQIPSDLPASESWQPVFRALFDVADLVLPGFGCLTCRPVLPGEEAIAFRSNPAADRIGYVAVQLGDRLEEAALLGFAAVEDTDDGVTLAIAALRPLATLLARLDELETLAATSPDASSQLGSNIPTQLGQWLQQQFERGWQAVEDVLGAQPALAFRRAAVRRAKLLSFGQATPEPHPFPALIVTLTPETPQQLCIHLQVCMTHPATLPPHLRLRVLTSAGAVFREISTGDADTFLHYEFTGQPGERFSVELVLNNSCITETFVI